MMHACMVWSSGHFLRGGGHSPGFRVARDTYFLDLSIFTRVQAHQFVGSLISFIMYSVLSGLHIERTPSIQVIPKCCIAHLYCAQFSRH